MKHREAAIYIVNKKEKKMKRLALLILVIAAAMSGGACVLAGPRGGLYTDITSPVALGHLTTYQITAESDYESLGFVEGVSTGTVIFGLIATGDFGYGAAIQDALLQAPGATRLLDITVDSHLTSILGIYAKYTTRVLGRAVRMKKK